MLVTASSDAVQSLKCPPLFAMLDGNGNVAWSLQVEKKAVLIGPQADGPGKLVHPGIVAGHAKVWREYKLVNVQPQAGPVWLNFVPVPANTVLSLVKGDRLHLGAPDFGNQLLLTCSNALASANKTAKANSTKSHEVDELYVSELSPAEYDVLACFGRGETEFEPIAEFLCRSVHTVRTQLNQIYQKLNVHSKSELAGLLLRQRDALENQKSGLDRILQGCNCRF